MVRTQIQLPDELYQKAKKLAESKEISFAELARHGLEYITSVYPSTEKAVSPWKLLPPQRLGWKGLSHKEIKEKIQDDSIRQ